MRTSTLNPAANSSSGGSKVEHMETLEAKAWDWRRDAVTFAAPSSRQQTGCPLASHLKPVSEGTWEAESQGQRWGEPA